MKQHLVIIVLITTAIVTALISPDFAQKQDQSGTASSQNTQRPPFDLNGIWVTNDGEEVELTAPRPAGIGNTVFAIFTGNNTRPNGGCKFGGNRQRFIDGSTNGKQLTGTMWRCTDSEPLFKGCGVPSVYTTTFKANALSKDEIYGYRRTEYWGPGGSGNCKYSRDPSGDRDIAFGLTRKKTATPSSLPEAGTASPSECPSGEQKKTSADDKALEQIKDGLKKTLALLNEQRKEVDRNTSSVKDLAQYKEELDQKIAGIKQWLEFWDRIKAFACMPPQVSQLLQRYAEEKDQNLPTSDFCTNMCTETVNWLSTVMPMPEYRKYQLKVGCMAATCN